jgi:MraZ protein
MTVAETPTIPGGVLPEDLRFRGSFDLTMDDKGRLSIPAEFRDIMLKMGEDTLVLSFHSSSLEAYPLIMWRDKEAEALRLPADEPDVQQYLRVIGLAVKRSPDKQGRILIPPAMRRHIGLDGNGDQDREVVLNGLLTKFEIWSRERWEGHLARFTQTPEDFAAMSKAVARFKREAQSGPGR